MAVELRKGQKVNLKKKVPIGEILINLNWDQPKKRFLFSPRPIDLDLGCLLITHTGQFQVQRTAVRCAHYLRVMSRRVVRFFQQNQGTFFRKTLFYLTNRLAV